MSDMHLRIKNQIEAFERKYAMSSEDFRSRFDSVSIGDNMDFIEWAATLEMRDKIQSHLSMIQ